MTSHYKRKPDRRHPLGDWREHAKMVGQILFYKVWSMQVLPFLVIGAALLGGSIGFARDLLAQAEHLDALTGRGSAAVQRAWWRLDFDPDDLPDGASGWTAVTQPSFCLRLRVLEPVAGRTAVSCLHYRQILDAFQAPYQLHRLPSGRSDRNGIPWRDGHGDLFLELLIPDHAWRWLSETPSVYRGFVPRWQPVKGIGEEGAVSYWDGFRMELEQPERDLVELWQQNAAIPIAFDPEAGERVMPMAFLQSDESREIAPFIIAVGIFGAIFWSAGLRMLMLTYARRTRAVVIIVTLACAPWWGQWVWRGLDLMMDQASEIGSMFESLMIPRPPTPEIMPSDYLGEPGDRRQVYSLDASIYAPLFEGIELQAPATPMTEAEAMQAVQEQVTTAVARMPAPERARRFLRLACYAAADLRSAGDLFLPAAEAWKDDEEVGGAARIFSEYQQDSGYPNHNIDCDAVMP